MAQRKKGKQRTVQSKPAKSDSVGWSWTKVLVLPILVGAVLAVGFPEVSQFAANAFQMLKSHQPPAVDPPETPTNTSADITESLPVAKQPEPAPIPPEIANFEPTYQKTIMTKKIFLEGRRIAPIELLPQTNTTPTDVKVYMFDDFLSAEECDGLRTAHEKHVEFNSKVPAILCFEGLDTLRKNLRSAKKSHVKVDHNVFTEGTFCLNDTFSAQVADWLKYNWSLSTAFYPGESAFSKKMAALIEETTGLRKENGGKFQLTSYPLWRGYKKHTDCREGGEELRDRMATVLVYLQDVESGGETDFPELGIWVKPKKGRALVWNNMDTDGKCIPSSVHQAKQVIKGHKSIIQRWYYYKSFWSLGRRTDPPSLPKRTEDQAMVLCDEYKHGSCRWYDEWSPDVMVDYRAHAASLV